MQAASGAQLAAFPPQSAFPEQVTLAHAGPHHGSPDPFSRFLDRSSIYYGDAATPPYRPIAGGHDWSDSLPFLPLHYDYQPDKPYCHVSLPDMSAPPPDPSPSPYPAGTATSSDLTQSIRNACATNS